MWLSLVERVLWEHEVAGSNPVIPILWCVGQAAKTLPFHGSNTSSILVHTAIVYSVYTIIIL